MHVAEVSHVSEAGPKLSVLLLPPSKKQNYRCAPLSTGNMTIR